MEAGNCIPYGTYVTLARQSEIDSFPINYPGCDIVEGGLTVSGNDITNLNKLLGLKRVGFLTIKNNINLINLKGLDSIKYINILEVYNNDMLFNFQGLGNVDTILSNFRVEDNNQLLNFSGMDNFRVIIDQFIIENNSSLKNFIGLKKINHIFGFKVSNNPSLVDLTGLESLNYMNYFDIADNANLINLKGLDGLNQLDQHCGIVNNNSLRNFIGLHNVEKFNSTFSVTLNQNIINCYGLEKVRYIGSLGFWNNNNLIDFRGLDNLDSVVYFQVGYNPILKNFNGLQNMKFVLGGIFDIINNNKLCSINELNSNLYLNSFSFNINSNPKLNCCKIIDTILNRNTTVSNINISNNASGCNDTAEIRTITTQNCCTTKYTTIKDTICSDEQLVFNNQMLANTGTYYDTLVNNGNDSIITLELKVYNKSYEIQNKNLCIGQSFTLSNGKIITTDGIYNDTIPNICDSIIEYHLNFINNITTNQNPAICKGKTYTLPKGNIVSVAGIYKDTLRSSFGCDSIITTNLTITNPIPFINTVSICDGQTYTLPNGNKVSIAGTYTDTIRQTNTCDSVIITDLSVFPNTFTVSLNATDTIESGNFTELQPVYTNGVAVNWIWSPKTNLSCDNCEIPKASPLQTTQYIINVVTEDGCEDTAQTKIVVRQSNIYVPQAFTPNNDGVNDVAEVFAVNPKLFSIKIYNRWSELVFESTDVNSKWNGMYKGEDCPVDSYSYILDVTLQNGKQYHKQSSILLLR